MKKSFNHGFTIVEVLIGINLGFIIITLMISFFLFFNKFYTGFIRKIEAKQNLFNTVYQINEFFTKQETYTVRIDKSGCKIIYNDGRSVTLKKNGIWVNNIPAITNLERTALIITLKTGNKIVISNGQVMNGNHDLLKTTGLYSTHVKSLMLKIEKEEYVTTIYYSTPKYNIKQFVNNVKVNTN